ncbi:MAG: sulfurtransferase [Nitrospirota bacterium]|nr:sulfurtransferase [Nitrospirota bacterium]
MNKGLISTSRLAAILQESPSDAAPVLLDVRGMAYLKGHLPGAVSARWQDFCDANSPVKGALHPDPAVLAGRFAALGVHPQQPVVIYSDPLENWGAEGRFFWMLHHLGLDDVRVLDGGYPKWRDERRGTTLLPTRPRPAAPFVPTPRAHAAINREGVSACVNGQQADTLVLDTRGTDEVAAEGRIPGAVNLPWSVVYREDGTFHTADDLRALFEAADVTPDKEIIPYCTGGVRSAVVFMLLHLLGYPRVRNYDGSWWEWTHYKMPVARG